MEHDDKTPKEAVSSNHDAIYNGLALYLERDTPEFYAAELDEAARCADKDPQTAIEMLAEKRNLREMDGLSETMLAEALWQLPREGRRSMLIAYLGFPFYDIAILPIRQRSEEHTSELPVTNAHVVDSLLLERKQKTD